MLGLKALNKCKYYIFFVCIFSSMSELTCSTVRIAYGKFRIYTLSLTVALKIEKTDQFLTTTS